MEKVGPSVVVGSLRAGDAKTAVTRLNGAHAGCGWLELRADDLSAAEVAYILHHTEREILVTVRSRRDGGGYAGDESGRLEILVAALRAGARAVDIELGSAAEALLATENPDRLVLSHHGGDCRPESLVALYERLASRRASRLKLVPEARSVTELAAVRDLLTRARRERRALACFAMGREAALGRLLACSWGSWATYGAIDLDGATAPGQFHVDELLDIHRVLEITDATRRFALIGQRVRRSPSPAMHSAGYRTHGLDARYFPVELDDPAQVEALCGIAALRGFAVTMPFKELLASRCVPADEVTAQAGAVNTVVVSPETWQGYNTDGPATVDRIRVHRPIENSVVVIAGAGGAARAAASSLARSGARVTLFNRDEKRGLAAADAVGVERRPWDELEGFRWDVLVNATPLGRDGEAWFPTQALRGQVVLDMAYGAGPTQLVTAARRAGLHVIDGAQQLVAQGVRQFRVLTGVDPSPEPMAAAVMQWMSRPAP